MPAARIHHQYGTTSGCPPPSHREHLPRPAASQQWNASKSPRFGHFRKSVAQITRTRDRENHNNQLIPLDNFIMQKTCHKLRVQRAPHQLSRQDRILTRDESRIARSLRASGGGRTGQRPLRGHELTGWMYIDVCAEPFPPQNCLHRRARDDLALAAHGAVGHMQPYGAVAEWLKAPLC